MTSKGVLHRLSGLLVIVALPACGGGGTSSTTVPVLSGAQANGPAPHNGGVVVTEHTVPHGLTGGVAIAKDGTIWFTQNGFIGSDSHGVITSAPMTLSEFNFSPSQFWPLMTANDSGVYFGVEYSEQAGFAVEEDVLQASPSLAFTGAQGIGQVFASMHGMTSVGGVAYATGSYGTIGAPPPAPCEPCSWVASTAQPVAQQFSVLGETGRALAPFNGLLYMAASETMSDQTTPNGSRIYSLSTTLNKQTLIKTLSAPALIMDMTAGRDQSLWFTDAGNNAIGRLSRQGTVIEFPVKTMNAGVNRIVQGDDGALWFTETTAGNVGRITMGGAVTEYALPSAGSAPIGIASRPACAGRMLWVAESGSGKLASIGY